MAKQRSHLVDRRHPELTVFGFARRYYPHSIPVAILNLMELFYSLWIEHRLSKDQTQELKKLEPRQTIEIPIRSYFLSGIRIEAKLECRTWDNEVLLVRLRFVFPSEMSFIAGKFGLGFNGDTACCCKWNRLYGTANVAASDYIYISTLENLADFVVIEYVDITYFWLNQTAAKQSGSIKP